MRNPRTNTILALTRHLSCRSYCDQHYRLIHNLRQQQHYPNKISNSTTLLHRYRQQVSSGNLINNDAQQNAAAALTPIGLALDAHLCHSYDDSDYHIGGFLRKWKRFISLDNKEGSGRTTTTRARGAYVWGSVGCGKSMLVDMLYDGLDSGNRNSHKDFKRRMHFHQFMEMFHRRVYEERTKSNRKNDVVKSVAEIIANKWKILYVDEFQVTDVADAVVMRRLFESLFENNVVLLATSNRAPEQLYYNGIQRELFTPLIPVIYDRCLVYHVEDGTDFRLRHDDQSWPSYLLWQDDGEEMLRSTFRKLAGYGSIREICIDVGGRTLHFNKAAPKCHILYTTFDDLCIAALSAADYGTICSKFETICIGRVPKLNVVHDRNAVTRLIRLVDTAYEQNVKLLISAQATIRDLFEGIGKEVVTEEAFAVERAISRLIEMQSKEYRKSAWKHHF